MKSIAKGRLSKKWDIRRNGENMPPSYGKPTIIAHESEKIDANEVLRNASQAIEERDFHTAGLAYISAMKNSYGISSQEIITAQATEGLRNIESVYKIAKRQNTDVNQDSYINKGLSDIYAAWSEFYISVKDFENAKNILSRLNAWTTDRSLVSAITDTLYTRWVEYLLNQAERHLALQEYKEAADCYFTAIEKADWLSFDDVRNFGKKVNVQLSKIERGYVNELSQAKGTVQQRKVIGTIKEELIELYFHWSDLLVYYTELYKEAELHLEKVRKIAPNKDGLKDKYTALYAKWAGYLYKNKKYDQAVIVYIKKYRIEYEEEHPSTIKTICFYKYGTNNERDIQLADMLLASNKKTRNALIIGSIVYILVGLLSLLLSPKSVFLYVPLFLWALIDDSYPNTPDELRLKEFGLGFLCLVIGIITLIFGRFVKWKIIVFVFLVYLSIMCIKEAIKRLKIALPYKDKKTDEILDMILKESNTSQIY